MKRLRQWFESIAFAGLRPSGQKAPKRDYKWLGPLSGPIERLLSGGPAPTDPLYLTNRPLSKKIKSWSLIAVPCLVLAVVIGIMLSNFLDPPESRPVKEPTAAEITAKLLPNVAKDIKLASPSEVEVVEIRVDHNGGSHLIGVVKNTTTHEIAAVELIVDLTDNIGSQVGAVSATVEKLPPSSTKAFQIAIKQHDAKFALVRDINAR
jgi:hypothetical protein